MWYEGSHDELELDLTMSNLRCLDVYTVERTSITQSVGLSCLIGSVNGNFSTA